MSKGQYRPDNPTLLSGELFIPRVDINGNFQTSTSNDYPLNISRGIVPGYRTIPVAGRNDDIDTTGARSFPSDLWPAPNDVMTYPFLSVASSLEVLSSSASDTAAGTGGQLAIINGLDANWHEYSTPEFISLNGTTPVQLSRQYLRINNFSIAIAGSTASNVGNVTLRVSGGGATVGYIPAGYGVRQSAIYSIPDGYSAQLQELILSFNRSTSGWAEICFQVRSAMIGGPWQIYSCFTVSNNQSVITYNASKFTITIPGGSDIKLRVREVSSNNSVISAFMTILQISNT